MMSTRDLYEMASMDALGLLDDDERQAFEAAFRAAPPHIQAEIRREQLREAEATDHLPQVEPPASLRARVIAAVMDTVHTLQTEPVATIGPGARVNARTAAFWRAACIGFATATVVLSGFVYTVADQNKQISQQFIQNDISDTVEQMGGERLVKTFTSPTTQFVSFKQAAATTADSDNTPSGVSLVYDPDKHDGFLLYSALPINTLEYTIKLADGTTKTFKVNQTDSAVYLNGVRPEQLTNMQILAPSRDGQEKILLESNDL